MTEPTTAGSDPAREATTVYRLSWEMVSMRELWRYSNADPTFYKNTTQTVPDAEIPEEHWFCVSKVTDEPWGQYHRLRVHAAEPTGFVRNVTLERGETAPVVWTPVEVP